MTQAEFKSRNNKETVADSCPLAEGQKMLIEFMTKLVEKNAY